jgi:hypothetical protein
VQIHIQAPETLEDFSSVEAVCWHRYNTITEGPVVIRDTPGLRCCFGGDANTRFQAINFSYIAGKLLFDPNLSWQGYQNQSSVMYHVFRILWGTSTKQWAVTKQ